MKAKKENDLKGSTFSFSHGGQISVTHVGWGGGEVRERNGSTSCRFSQDSLSFPDLYHFSSKRVVIGLVFAAKRILTDSDWSELKTWDRVGSGTRWHVVVGLTMLTIVKSVNGCVP